MWIAIKQVGHIWPVWGIWSVLNITGSSGATADCTMHTKALRAPPSFLHRGAVAARVVRTEVKAYSKIFTVFISNVAVEKQEGGAGWGLQISVLLAIYLAAALAVQLAEGRLGARFS